MMFRLTIAVIVMVLSAIPGIYADFPRQAVNHAESFDDPTPTPTVTPASTPTPTPLPPTPTPADGFLYVPYEYPSIQIAIAAATDGDTVYVAPGTYRGDANTDLKFGGRAIHLTSFPGEPTPVIDCLGTDSNYHQGFIFNSLDGEGLVVSNMAVVNGFYGLGGGMWFLPGSAPLIRNCLIENCAAEWSGGGIQAFSTGAILNRVEIRNCVSIDGGGAAVCIQGGHDTLTPILYRCKFINNECMGPNFGVVHIDSGSEPIITSCEFIDNVKSSLWFDSGHMHFLDINNCLFVGNTIGVTVQTGVADIANCTFNDNGEYAVTAYENLAQVDLVRSCIWGPNDLAHNITSATNCNMPEPDRDGAKNCFYSDPMFVQGASGGYYVYQGHPDEPFSPNVNTGGVPVWQVQYPGPGYNVALENMTTSIVHSPDERFSDVGYHYTLFDDEPTPQPPPERPVIEDILGCTEDFTNNMEMRYLVTTLVEAGPDSTDIASVEMYWENFPVPWSLVDDGTCGDAVANDGRYSRLLTFNAMQLPDYQYELNVVAVDTEGEMSEEITYLMSVENPNKFVGSGPEITGRYLWYEPVTPGKDEEGFLWILAAVDHPGGLKQIESVEILYEGADTGIRLYDIGSAADLGAGDGLYGAMVIYNGIDIDEPASVVLDVMARDVDGRMSRAWPIAWRTRNYQESQ